MTLPNMDNNSMGVSCIKMDQLLCIAFELSRTLVIIVKYILHLTSKRKNDDIWWLGDLKHSLKSMRHFKSILHFPTLAFQMLYEMNTSSVGLSISLSWPSYCTSSLHKGKCAVRCSEPPQLFIWMMYKPSFWKTI